MERCKLYCRGRVLGEITLCPQGTRTRVEARMEDPGDGLYRAVLVGERGTLKLGVLEPKGGFLQLCRCPYSRDVESLGPLARGEANCSISFGTTPWQSTDRPADLLRDPLLSRRLENCRRAWWRREGELLRLALPLEPGKPFPLEALFCLARIEGVEGVECAVYAFDAGGTPMLPGKQRKI